MSISISEFNRQVNIAIPYITAQNERLLVPTTLYDRLITSLVNWNALWAKSQDPATRTPVVVGNLHELETTFLKDYRLMQQSLKHSGDVTLTEQDHEELFINKDKSRTVVPAPTIIPTINIIGRAERKIKIQISNPAVPDLNYTKLPEGVNSVNVFIAITDADAAIPADDDYRLFKTEGKSNIELLFSADDEKRVAYIKVSFANEKGEAGPLSNPINTVIPN